MSTDQLKQARVLFEEEFKEWLEHPTTKKFRALLKKDIQDRKDAWASGELLSSFAHEQFVKEAVAKGYISCCERFLDLEAKDLETDE